MKKLSTLIIGALICPLGTQAALTLASLYTGNVGSSIDGVGSNSTPVGTIGAEVPVGATIRKAYLYAAGTPSPWDGNAPTSLADYNAAGISLGGTAVTNFSKLVGSDASLNRPDLGMFFTGRADVTSAVEALIATNPGSSSHSWAYVEGAGKNSSIDGGVLAIAYEHPSLPEGSVAFFDGGQDTGGETSLIMLGSPLGDPSAPGFYADLSLAVSFSIGGSQVSEVSINGTRLTSSAGGADDGGNSDGSLISVGGLGDSNTNPANPLSNLSPDDELYDLRPFLSENDTQFSITTINPSDDDNIFFVGLTVSAEIIPEPSSFLLLFAGSGLLLVRRRQ